MIRIILASKSPRRKMLFTQTGLTFEVAASNIDESIAVQSPEIFVEKLAQLKAEDVAASYSNSLIIGADTIVVHKNNILGKPEDATEAAEILGNLSGSTHSVFTGVALIITNKEGLIEAKKTFYEQTNVQFSTLAEQEIQTYVESGSPLDKAGAYGIQDDLGALFIEKIEGDYYNVVGFPLNRFYRELKAFKSDIAHKIFHA